MNENHTFRHVYVWDVVVRVLHWLHVSSIFVLGLTGYYIGSPFVVIPSETAQTYLMGWVRGVHFIASFVFVIGFLVRAYWAFFGSHYASWRYWIPADKKRLKLFGEQLKYYLFLKKDRPLVTGHNPVAGLSYTALGIMILVQALTGYALYAEPTTSGFWRVGFGWLLTLFGNQTLRLVHHLLMWLFVVFFIVHLYMAILADLEEKDASITSIINGVKFEKAE